MGHSRPQGFLDLFSVATLPSTHPGIIVERGGKAIQATTQQGFLCYGQYKEGYPLKTLQAVFSLLVDNNTHDDAYVLILDVYDHQSDRLLAKRLLTRKDFPKANEFNVFTFDFTPPGPQARMEFRIYYMGYAYVLADKIAVIDPAQVTITSAAQLPPVEAPVVPLQSQPLPNPSGVEIPPWRMIHYGQARGTVVSVIPAKFEVNRNKGELWYGAEIGVNMTGSTQDCADLTYLYVEVVMQFGFFKQWANFSAYSGAMAGVMLRESLDPQSKFLLVNGTQIFCRARTNGPITETFIGERATPTGMSVFLSKAPGPQAYDLTISLRGGQQITNHFEFDLGRHYFTGIALGAFQGTFELGSKYKDSAYLAGA